MSTKSGELLQWQFADGYQIDSDCSADTLDVIQLESGTPDAVPLESLCGSERFSASRTDSDRDGIAMHFRTNDYTRRAGFEATVQTVPNCELIEMRFADSELPTIARPQAPLKAIRLPAYALTSSSSSSSGDEHYMANNMRCQWRVHRPQKVDCQVVIRVDELNMAHPCLQSDEGCTDQSDRLYMADDNGRAFGENMRIVRKGEARTILTENREVVRIVVETDSARAPHWAGPAPNVTIQGERVCVYVFSFVEWFRF